MNFLSTFLVIALASVAIAQDATTDSVLQGCERPCPKNLMPVCGFDGKHHQLFNNECMMQNEHCKNGKTWVQTRMNQCLFRTEVAEKKACEVPCTRELRPTCGSDGVEHRFFNNPCELRNQHCIDGHQWFETRTNDCLIIVDAETPAKTESCEVPCTREMMPVCGFDGQHHKIFNNKCLMENEHCKDGHNWFQARFTDCLVRSEPVQTECETPCTREMNPTCGFDGQHHKLFSNPCMMKNEHCKNGRNWVQTRMADCLVRSNDVVQTECETPCTREMNPTCGFDGQHHKLFSNPCMMKNEHCKNGRNWVQTRMADCLVRSNDVVQTECETPCTREMNPTCGFDGQHHKLFSNPCMMKNEHCKNGRNWVQTRMADCLVRSNDVECPTICTDIYAPVCGFNGVEHKVFASECVMNAHNCQNSPAKYFVKSPLRECPEHIF